MSDVRSWQGLPLDMSLTSGRIVSHHAIETTEAVLSFDSNRDGGRRKTTSVIRAASPESDRSANHLIADVLLTPKIRHQSLACEQRWFPCSTSTLFPPPRPRAFAVGKGAVIYAGEIGLGRRPNFSFEAPLTGALRCSRARYADRAA